MRNDSTVFVALDVHQKSIVAAYAVAAVQAHAEQGLAGALRLRGWAVRLCGVSLSHRQGLRLHRVCTFQGRT